MRYFKEFRINSPLRYFGLKPRTIKRILTIIPEHITTVCSPFLGSGSLELYLDSQGLQVFSYDNSEALVNFWKETLKNSKEVADQAQIYFDKLNKDFFHDLQRNYSLLNTDLEKAAAFYILNRAGFSGIMFKDYFNLKFLRLSDKTINYLGEFKTDLKVKLKDYKESITLHKDDFLYLDPPIQENDQFSHKELFNILNKRDNWLLSYNNQSLILDLYKDYKIFKPRPRYSINNLETNEVLILSKDLEEYHSNRIY